MKHRLFPFILFLAFTAVPVRATEDPEAENDTASKESGDASEDDGDPVNMGTGEFYFKETLVDLGGPLPLRMGLAYGSQMDRKRYHCGLPRKFSHSLRATIFVGPGPVATERRAFVETGMGDELVFRGGTGAVSTSWTLVSGEMELWRLDETAQYFYLADQRQRLCRIFKKHPGANGTTELRRAFEVYRIDTSGNRLTFALPANPETQGPLSVSDGLGRSLTFNYAAVGANPEPYLQSVTDHTGRTWTFTFEDSPADNAGDVTLRTMANPPGEARRFSYGGKHNITAVRMPRGNTPWSQTYRTDGDPERGIVATQSNAAGQTWRLRRDLYLPYQIRESIFTWVNPDGTQRRFVHTQNGSTISRITDESGVIMQFGNDTATKTVNALTDRRGQKTHTVAYDNGAPSTTNFLRGQIRNTNTRLGLTFTNPDNGETVFQSFTYATQTQDPEGTRSFGYDTAGVIHLQRITAGDGGEITFTRNPRGQPLTATNQTGGTVTFTYDAAGNAATRQDTDAGLTGYAYDAQNRLTVITHPGGATTAFTYDAADRILTAADERGAVTRYTYDANGSVRTITRADGTPLAQTTTFGYDDLDRVTSLTDPANASTLTAYTYWSEPESITAPGNAVTRFGYSPVRFLTSVTDAAGFTSRLERDAEGLLTGTMSAAGRTTGRTYDTHGHPATLTDGEGATSNLTTNFYGRITQIINRRRVRSAMNYHTEARLSFALDAAAPGNLLIFARDKLGNITKVTDGSLAEWKFEFTPMGRLKKIIDPGAKVWDRTYDTRGRLATITHPGALVETLGYDAVGGLASRSFSDGLAFTYTRDLLGRVTATAGGTPIAVNYDTRDLVTTTTIHGVTFTATYDARRRLRTLDYGGAATVTYDYDARSLLTSVTDSLTGSSVTCEYDPDGLMTKCTRSNGAVTNYEHNGNGLVKRIQHAGFADLRLTRDAGDHILKVENTTAMNFQPVLAAGTTTISHNTATEVTSAGFTHDARGRCTADGARDYAWDSADRLTSVTIGAQTVANDWTADGLISRETRGGAVTEFLYHLGLPGTPILAERSGGVITRLYICTPGGEPLWLIELPSKAVRFFHFDHTGSTMFLTGPGGTVTDSYKHTPCGAAFAHTGSSTQPFTWHGQRGVRRVEDGLYHMRRRWFDSRTARFLTRDPLWLQQLTSPEQFAPYGFARGNPITFHDAGGEEPEAQERRMTYLSYTDSYLDGGGNKVSGGEAQLHVMDDEQARGAIIRGGTLGRLEDDGTITWLQRERQAYDDQETPVLLELREFFEVMVPITRRLSRKEMDEHHLPTHWVKKKPRPVRTQAADKFATMRDPGE